MAYYRIEIDDNEQFGSPDKEDTAAAYFTPSKKYETNLWYWRVCVFDWANKQGPCTDSTIILDPTPYKIRLPVVIRE